MLHTKIDSLIAEATKCHASDRLRILRAIKNEFTNFEKSGEGPLTDTIETKILLKMAAQRKDSMLQYQNANRMDLYRCELDELRTIETFIPKQPTEEEIQQETIKVIESLDHSPSMKDMKSILSKVQEVYPTTNGTIVSKVLKCYL